MSAKATKYIPKYWERSVKRKSNLNFNRVIKNSSFDQQFLYMYMVQTFLKILCWQFLVSHRERLFVSSGTLSCKTWNISIFFSSSNQVFSIGFEHSFLILKFQCFMMLLNLITSKYSFFRRIFEVKYQYFQICLFLVSFLVNISSTCTALALPALIVLRAPANLFEFLKTF